MSKTLYYGTHKIQLKEDADLEALEGEIDTASRMASPWVDVPAMSGKVRIRVSESVSIHTRSADNTAWVG